MAHNWSRDLAKADNEDTYLSAGAMKGKSLLFSESNRIGLAKGVNVKIQQVVVVTAVVLMHEFPCYMFCLGLSLFLYSV